MYHSRRGHNLHPEHNSMLINLTNEVFNSCVKGTGQHETGDWGRTEHVHGAIISSLYVEKFKSFVRFCGYHKLIVELTLVGTKIG